MRTWAPGRVNLMGDHVDYCGGPVLPMAVDLGTTVEGLSGGSRVHLRSVGERHAAVVDLAGEAVGASPLWARYVGGVVAEVRPVEGFTGLVGTTLPVGAGLASSAALTVAVALALGFAGTPRELAVACQRAEQRASGVPCGVMDQVAAACGVEGAALLLDCATLSVEPVPLPGGLAVLVVHSGESRSLAGSAYAERRAACERAAASVGPLPAADRADVARLGDPVLRRRARHVVEECERVRAVAASRFDRDVLADAMAASHASLRDDFEVSTPALDALVDDLSRQPGVVGARLTGAGFGGCVVAVCEAGAAPAVGDRQAWWVRPSGGARRLEAR